MSKLKPTRQDREQGTKPHRTPENSGLVTRETIFDTDGKPVAEVVFQPAGRLTRAANQDTKLSRSFKIVRDKINVQDRTVELAFSSEEPVERWGENEVLSHDKGDYDFTRLNDSHPLLLGHDEYEPRDQIGVIVQDTAKVDGDKVGRCMVRFSQSDLGKEIFQDVLDGIRKLVSVGYDRTGIVKSDKAKDGRITTRYKWAPTHVAIVPVPADMKAGVGRDNSPAPLACPTCGGPYEADDEECPGCHAKLRAKIDFSTLTEAQIKDLPAETKQRIKTIFMADTPAPTTIAPATPPAIDEKEIRSAATVKERTRLSEINTRANSLIKDHPQGANQVRALVERSLKEDMTVDQFSISAMEEVLKAKPVRGEMAVVDDDVSTYRNYSMGRAIKSAVENGEKNGNWIPTGFEGETHEELSKRNLGYRAKGFLVPSNAPSATIPRNMSRQAIKKMRRDLQANVFGQGGATVATDLIPSVIEILRNRMVTERLGVHVMAGLEGNIVIPRQTATATAYSVPEITGLTISTQALDQISMTPHRVGAYNQYSKQLILQSSIDVENFIRDDLTKVIALDWDRIILNGQGSASEALGIMNTPGIGSMTFGGAASWANIVLFETIIAAMNADVANMAYVTDPTAKGKLKTAAKLFTGATTVAAFPLWDGNLGDSTADGVMNGYRAAATNQMPNHQLLFGNFEDVILGLWGGYDVVVNPYSLDTNAEVRITVNTWGDVTVRHPQSFCLSADSAAQ